MGIRENYLSLLEEIKKITDREIKVVCVSKGVDVENILEVISAGAKIIGESRVQEALKKYEYLRGKAELHMIGNLQSNKVKYAVKIFDMIQSVNRESIALEIDKISKKIGKKQKVLIEVNVSKEETKQGILPEKLPELLEFIEKLENIEVCGLMTIAPLTPAKEIVRKCFSELRELRDKYRHKFGGNISLEELSMGMSDDYQIAIEEGATMIRIGRKIFGYRKY